MHRGCRAPGPLALYYYYLRPQEFKGGGGLWWNNEHNNFKNFMNTRKLILRLLGMDTYKNTDRLHDTIILYKYTFPYEISWLKFISKWQTNESLLDGMSA
jgi:hypothetical protein